MQKISLQTQNEGRLDVAVSAAAEVSRSMAAKWIEEGSCLVNGKPQTKTGFKVKAGDMLDISIPEPVEMTVEKQEIPLNILYEDEDVAVVDKPWGMVVHPAPGNEKDTLVNALLFAMEDLSGIGGVKRPGIVHRLDKDTSGVIMIAKNDMAHESLSRQLKERTMDKRYLALVDGGIKEDSGKVDAPIARSKKDRKKMAVDPEGREAHTEWTVLERLKDSTLLEVHILTGRTHQIRVHMRHIHHPVAGDPIYGAKNGIRASRLMLHAWKLSFDHPRTGERMHFELEPPAEYVKILERVRRETK